MDKTLNISVIYGVVTCLSLILAGGYCAVIKKKENGLIWLYFSVFVANLGYFTLSISKTVEEALLANRLAYLGCVFLPFFMLMTIMKVCKVNCSQVVFGFLVGISAVIFLITASQGYSKIYYKEVTLVFINGAAKLQKVYGPLHNVYYIYLFTYLALMLGVIVYSFISKKIVSYKQAALLVVVVCFNIVIWFVEQLINWDFEFLSISYVASEVLLLLIYGMIQDYEVTYAGSVDLEIGRSVKPREVDIETLISKCPEIANLSGREMDVFRKLLEDKKRKEIADELCITENTVKKHITSIFSKLNISSRSQLLEKLR